MADERPGETGRTEDLRVFLVFAVPIFIIGLTLLTFVIVQTKH